MIVIAAMISLIQFPYSFGIYFCYAVPTLILALAGIVFLQPTAPRQIHLMVLLFYLGFAAIWLNHGHIRRIGVQYVARNFEATPKLDRLGLTLSNSQARLYQDVIAEVHGHSQDGSFIYAANDCPEIYFLSGRKNPTRTFYEFFDSDYTDDGTARIERLQEKLSENDVRVIVFHWKGEFSGPVSFEFAQQIAKQYPNAKHFLRDPQAPDQQEPVFTVAWR